VLRTYLAVAVLVRLADEGARVALVLLALDRTGRASLGGALVAALLVPQVVAAPVVGRVADRTAHPRALAAACLAGFGVALIGCAGLVGRAPDLLALVVAALGGCVAPMAFGGLSGQLRSLVPDRSISRAYSLDVVTYNSAGVLGPAIAGALTAVWSAAAALGVLGGCALVASSGAAWLPLVGREGRAVAGGGLLVGLSALFRRRPLRAVTLGTTLGVLGFGAMPIAAALLAGDRHGLAGALVSAFALGSLIGSVVHARWPLTVGSAERTVVLALIAMAVPLPLAAVADAAPIRLAAVAVSGFFSGPMTAAMFASRDRWTSVAEHTQAFTVAAGLRITAAAAGSALAGAMAVLGGPALLLGIAAGQLLGAAVAALVLGGHRAGPQSDRDRAEVSRAG